MSAFHAASAADGADILQLFRDTPQRGRVVLNFEREPDYFRGGSVICQEPEVHIARSTEGKLLMLYGIGSRLMYVNGVARKVRYAHDLRIAEHARGGRLILRMSKHVGSFIAPDDLVQTVILSENTSSMTSVASGRAGLPTYYPNGDIETSLLFRVPRGKRSSLTFRPATLADLPAMQKFHDQHAPQRQFYPCYQFSGIIDGNPYFSGLQVADYWLALDNEKIVGMAALWDQKSFKQTRVISYPAGLSWLRFFWNFWTSLVGGLHLPPAGGMIRYLMLHSVLIRDEDPQVLRELLAEMSHSAARKSAAISAGFFLDDPLRAAVQGCRRQTMRSHHFLIGYHGDPRDGLDGRPGYIELARL
ncbi:hypothetical protein [Alcanivorax sp. 1008]|uniref:hypothetical protein n=1 Tax=Alcanivorax sp. 1008 TaxID=2816853 RepID=UPI001DEBC3C6|nr:hypothetical protein [Alcanivorax sp. 1008]MCC1497623.1 hypothetical protein [Alcanivorax sp. 1008]